MSTIVIMPGGFHPFHAGHADLYQQAKKAFPGADIYVAATNDQSERPFPFALKEKLAKLAGVESGHFVQVKSPFQAKEITQNYNPEEDVLIFVRSEKDRNEPPKPGGTKKDGSPAYFQPYTGKDLQPFSQHAYIDYLKTVEFGPGITSATQIRNAWPTLNDKRKTALVMSLYPAAQKNLKLAQNVVGMFDQVMGGQEGMTEGFGINYPGTYEQENNMIKGHGQRRIGNLTSENIDPELINVLQYAQQHYPNSKNKQEAFMKFVQRALGHSKSDDERQDNELKRLDKEVDQLQKQVNVTESTDYLEEK
jgi:cytidyltransferase-like protein